MSNFSDKTLKITQKFRVCLMQALPQRYYAVPGGQREEGGGRRKVVVTIKGNAPGVVAMPMTWLI